MSDTEARQRAVDENYEAFKAMLPELAKSHPGKYALMREREVVEFFDTARDALVYAQKEYPDGLYSIQQVTETIADLGYFSHAMCHSFV